jgi:hypothetical protein
VKASPDIRVRPARLDDCEALVAVHCSGVTEWFRYVEGKKIADARENLGLWDRYLNWRALDEQGNVCGVPELHAVGWTTCACCRSGG